MFAPAHPQLDVHELCHKELLGAKRLTVDYYIFFNVDESRICLVGKSRRLLIHTAFLNSKLLASLNALILPNRPVGVGRGHLFAASVFSVRPFYTAAQHRKDIGGDVN